MTEDDKRKLGQVVFHWQFKEPIGKHEKINCPICGGDLLLDQMPGSGYVNGACTTPECVSFSIGGLDVVRQLAKEIGLNL